MAERKVYHKVFVYYEDGPDPVDPDKTIRLERMARRGEVLDFSAADIERGERTGAFFPEATTVSTEGGEGTLDPATASLADLTTWITEDHPTVDEVVGAAGTDKVTARKLLDAENAATGNEPRKGVEAGLTHIIADSGQ